MLMATPPYTFTPSFSSATAGHMSAGIPSSSLSSSSSTSMLFGNFHKSPQLYPSKRKYEDEATALNGNSRPGILNSLKRMRVSSPPYDTPLYHKQKAHREPETFKETEEDINMDQEVELEDIEENQMEQPVSSSTALVTTLASKGSSTSLRPNKSNDTSSLWKIRSSGQTTFPIQLTHPDKVGAIIVYDPALRSLVPRLQVGSSSGENDDEYDWDTTSDESDEFTTPRFEVLDEEEENEIKVTPPMPDMVDEEDTASGEAMEID
jgi:hypothetical protein